MNKSTTLAAMLLGTTSLMALSNGAIAQTAEPVETVTVTGSLVVNNMANAPTPVTIVDTSQILATTPSNLQDALGKLPAFLGSTNQRSSPTSTQGAQANRISLRSLGITRTLVLFDGKRVAPSDPAGAVNIDGLPQLLIQRVDVVTGGASATYGSDAVAGVVNFVIDKHFTGFKYEAHAGISGYTDGAQEEIGFAAGTDLFGGRGHIEGDVRFFHQDLINMNARPYGANGQAWMLTGNGTAANPFVHTPYGRLINQATGGGVVTCKGCAANWTTFTPGGELAPFNIGTPTGTPGTSIGGDGGGYYNSTSFSSELRQAETFLRFSYDIQDDLSFYIQGNWNESYNINNASPHTINPGRGRGGTIPVTQAYLQPDVAAKLTAGNTEISAYGVPVFHYGIFYDYVAGAPANKNSNMFRSLSLDRNMGFTTGLDGRLLNKYDWTFYMTYNENRQEGAVPRNANIQKFLAGEDAVINPATNQVVCQVSLTANANLYPGCVPINVFGQNMTQSMFNWYSERTQYEVTNSLLDVGGTINGDLFALPAGPLRAGVSAEIRDQAMTVDSRFNPGLTVDCTGLRLCVPNTAALYDQPTTAPLSTKTDTVWELAAEFDIPVIKDVPLIQSMNFNLAGRHTEYSTSGAVDTWKIGFDQHIDDNFRIRATTSVDIRAPNLWELYQPLTVTTGPFADLLTGGNFSVKQSASGNSKLTPEIAHTYTAGIVFTPTFIPGLTATVDYYKINMSNAITTLNGSTTAIQQLCIASGGTSPYCSLVERPFPYTNTTLANYPTVSYTRGINSAKVYTEGVDVDINYGFDMSDVISDVNGTVNLRNILGIQPYLNTVSYPGSAIRFTPVPKGRMVTMLSYQIGSWSINVQNNWFSGFSRLNRYGEVYVQPRISSYDQVDLSVGKDITIGGGPARLLLSVQNIGDSQPPIYSTRSTNPGLSYPVPTGENGMGRYFILGLKGNL